MEWVLELLLILKGFFSGSEIAMVNSDKFKLRHKAKIGDRGASLVLKLFKTPDVILGTTLVGTNLATVTISTLGALIFVDLFGVSGDLISVLVLTTHPAGDRRGSAEECISTECRYLVPRLIYGLRFSPICFTR